MRNIVFVGSHLGYPMDKTPLGGGAMVALQLVRHWVADWDPRYRLTLLGSGAHAPTDQAVYLQFPHRETSPDLVALSEMGYARFCREFEAATTKYLLDNQRTFEAKKTVVIVNDISESPDIDRLAAAGYRIISIWHVDVVEFFNRIYMKNILAPERWTRGFGRIEYLGLARLVPDMLRLVFQKQRSAVQHSSVLVLPSRQMAVTISRCYEGTLPDGPLSKLPLEERMEVVPWGGWKQPFNEDALATEASRLRAHYQLRTDSRVLVTMSRISPEKGIHLLLEALSRLEKSERFRGVDLCLFICGEIAFMRGESYGRKVRGAAERLKKIRVFFPGYLSAFEKQVHFRLGDLFVSPSVHESYGLTLVEAMQCGLPVLASDHYGVDEILDPAYGRTVSYEIPRSRVRNLAAALGDLLSDPEELRRMGRRAKTAAGKMDFGEAAARLLKAATDLIPE